ncbi:amt-3, partial [Symbiodinium pilosum]
MWKLLSACFVAALAEPAKHNATSELAVDVERSSFLPRFCKQGIAELDFEDFKHGDKFPPNKINGVTIAAKGPAGCTGPLQVIDPKKFNFNAPKMLIWSRAGIPQQCHKGPTVVTFTFQKLQDVELVDLWDLVQGATGEAFDKKGKAIVPKKVSPTGMQMNNKRYTMRFNARKVKKLVITLNGGVDPKRPNDNP